MLMPRTHCDRASTFRNGGKRSGVLVAALTCIASLSFVAPAQAHDEHDNHDDDSIELDVTANVRQRCGISALQRPQTEAPRIDQSATLVFPFAIDCNMPFAIGASSSNGGLKMLGGETAAAKGFATTKAYRASLSFATNGSSVDSAPCASRQLASGDNGDATCDFFGTIPGEGLSSHDRIAIDRTGALTVQWDGDMDSDGRRHAAGSYQDVITVVIGARS